MTFSFVRSDILRFDNLPLDLCMTPLLPSLLIRLTILRICLPLSERILTPLKEGAAAGSVPDVEKLLREYYEIRGLDEGGKPKKEVLIKAGLQDLAEKLYG